MNRPKFKDIKLTPDSGKITFEEWKTWFGLKIEEAFKNKILCHKHGTMYQINEPCPKCLEEKNN